MRILALILLAVPALALSNKVTLQDKSGSGQGSRTWIIPRYFAADEICDVPKPYVSGSAATYWQSHVESRWPASTACAGGSVQLAVIAVEASVGTSANVDTDFRNTTDYCHLGSSATCAAAGASKTDLLNFDAGGGAASWGAKITATTGGISFSRSARDMMTSDHYQIVRNGPLYVEVIVREGPDAVSAATTRTTNFGWQCTASCTFPYSGSTWADNSTYYSIRPTFHLRFYRRWSRVEVDYVAHSGWADRFVDQRIESFTLYSGGAETTAAITQSNAFVLSPRMTWIEDTFWNGGAPGSSHIDLNTRYMIMSKLIPPQDIDRYPITTTAPSYQNSIWTASDQAVTTSASLTPKMGNGNIAKGMATGGSNAYSGIFPSWTSQYLYSMSSTLAPIILGQARAGMHFPWAYLESATSGTWATGTTVNPFGRPITVEQRTSFVSGLLTNTQTTSYVSSGDRIKSPEGQDIIPTCVHASCMVTCTTTEMWCIQTSASANGLVPDRAHHPEMFFVPYLMTGKPMYREAQYHVAAWQFSALQPKVDSNTPVGRWYEAGLIYDVSNMARAFAWPLRTLAHAVILAPDGSDEKTYFTRLLNNNVEMHEGRLEITNGAYPPTSPTAPYGCPSTSTSYYWNSTPTSPGTISKWCLGRYAFDYGMTNPMKYPGWRNIPSSSPIPRGYGVDLRNASSSYPIWMSGYWAVTLGHLRDLGFTQVAKLQESASTFFLRLFADSGCGPDWTCTSYYIPLYNAAGTNFLQTPAQVKAAIVAGGQLSRAISSSDTTIRVAGLIGDQLGPIWELGFTSTGGPIKIGSEWVSISQSSASSVALSGGAITAVDDRITYGSAHNYLDGDLIDFHPGLTGSYTDFPLASTDAACIMPSGKGHCRWFVKVISSTVIEVYQDSALTSKVNFTADQSGIRSGYTQVTIDSAAKCGAASCRGILGTTAASHTAGEAVTRGTAAPAWSAWFNDPGFGYGHYARAALAYAATYPISITDSITGKAINPRTAYARFSGSMQAMEQYGEPSTCSSYTNCGANRVAITPRADPKNVRTEPSAGQVLIRYVAPNGRNCTLNVASSFSSSDDSGDLTDSAFHTSRSQIFSGLPAGTYQYRITCSTGRVLGSVVVP